MKDYGKAELTDISLSKDSIYESQTITQAAIDEALRRHDRTISNEKILRGDILLGTYEVLDDAISGGMGSVWRVHHRDWGTELAMKRPQPRFFAEGSDRRKEEFISECENWIHLGLHPNIVACYYVREIGGVPTIFSEWMDNGSIKDRIRDASLYHGTDEEIRRRLLDIAIQTARAVAYFHNIGLIHQDIKPANILLTPSWEAKIADFGLARAREGLKDDGADGTAVHVSGYTPEYCPAEQAQGEGPAQWMDIYAWALSVLEMYCRKRVWTDGAEAKESIEDIIREEGSYIPYRLQILLRKCLETTEIDAGELVRQLEAVYVDEFGSAYPRREIKHEYQTADALNNTALSYLDLNKELQAVQCWEKAKLIDGTNANVIYNHSLYQWRRGQIDAEEAVERVKRIPDVNDRKKCIAAIQKERDGYVEVLHDGIAEEFSLGKPPEEQPEAYELFDACRSYMEGEYVTVLCRVNDRRTAAFLLINKYILFIKNLKTGSTTGPIYARDYGSGHFSFIRFFNEGEYVACNTSNRGGDCLNIWESESGRYLDSVPVSLDYDDMMDFFQYGGVYYPGIRSEYIVSRIENMQQRIQAEEDFRSCMRQADEAYDTGDLKQAFKLIEEAIGLPGFNESEEAIRRRQHYGAALETLGVRRIVMTEKTVPEQALHCADNGDKLLAADEEYSIYIENGRLSIHDSTFPGGWHNNSLGDNIRSADFLSAGSRIVYGDSDGNIAMLNTAPFAGYRVGGEYRLRASLSAPCDSPEDNGLLFALDDSSFALKQNDGYHLCLIDEKYSFDEEVMAQSAELRCARKLQDSGMLTAKPGDTVFFGMYEQRSRKKEALAWILLDRSEEEALLIMKQCCGPYGAVSSYLSTVNQQARRHLNKEFIDKAFDEDERSMLVEGKVSLLSEEQMHRYLPEESDRLCEPTALAKAGGIAVSNGYARWLTEREIIDFDGRIFGYRYTGENVLGLRPVIRIKLRMTE